MTKIMLSEFISNLSYRFRSENDLSDITWTMCQTSKGFQRMFLKFFFPHFDDDCSELILKRETPKDDSRVDFYFYYRKELYLIENKIYDKNHHFEQYCLTYGINPSNLGYIVNYDMVKDGFEVKRWEDFFHYLLSKLETFPKEEEELVKSYVNYLKNVCSIFYTNKPMNLSSIFSLYTFYKNLDKVLDNKTSEKYSKSYDHPFSKPHEGRMGKGFSITFNNIGEPITGWFGIYFNEEKPSIWIYIDQKCLESPYPFRSCDIFSYEEIDDQAYWFKYEIPSDFDDLELKDQIVKLSLFYEEVINTFYEAKVSR